MSGPRLNSPLRHRRRSTRRRRPRLSLSQSPTPSVSAILPTCSRTTSAPSICSTTEQRRRRMSRERHTAKVQRKKEIKKEETQWQTVFVSKAHLAFCVPAVSGFHLDGGNTFFFLEQKINTLALQFSISVSSNTSSPLIQVRSLPSSNVENRSPEHHEQYLRHGHSTQNARLAGHERSAAQKIGLEQVGEKWRRKNSTDMEEV
jgi:hypothetical protein